MKKIILVLLVLVTLNVTADQKLDSKSATIKTEGEVFGYPAETKIDIYGELKNQGYKVENKNVYYMNVGVNKVAKTKISSGKFNYDTKPSNLLGHVLRNEKEITFSLKGQQVQKGDWYSLEYNKTLTLFIANELAGSGQIVTLRATKKGLNVTSRGPDENTEKNTLIKMTENNLQIEAPVEKKPSFFDRAKKAIKGNQ
jgi:hypothetical protein